MFWELAEADLGQGIRIDALGVETILGSEGDGHAAVGALGEGDGSDLLIEGIEAVGQLVEVHIDAKQVEGDGVAALDCSDRIGEGQSRIVSDGVVANA